MTMTTASTLASQFKATRRAGTPLLFYRTADPAALMEALVATLDEASEPALQWDLVRGLRGLNKTGATAAQQLTEGQDPAAVSAVPTDALRLVAKAPRGAVVFMLNAPRYWDSPDVLQAIWNLRDPFKSTKRTLVAVGSDGAKIPAELEPDVIAFVQPLPSREELAPIVEKLHNVVKLAPPVGRDADRIVDLLSGLSAFSAEQITAMSLTKNGLDFDGLRDRRRLAIENTPGMSIYRGTETFADLGGLSQIKKFFTLLGKAREPIRAIAFIDEIEKALAGAGAAGGPGDNTGIAQDQLRALLTNIDGGNLPTGTTTPKGATFFGVPGAGKTAFAHALANELGVELVNWDLGAMMVSAAGGSQDRIRQACAVQNAIGGGGTLYIATCNSTAALPTELRRRFRTYGEWFFDLPQADETPAILAIYLKKYGLEVTGANPLPDISEWTGAEIKSMCYLAYNLDISFRAAAEFVVSMKVSAADVVARLRQQASGRFLSVSAPGFYCGSAAGAPPAVEKTDRSITLEDVAASVVLGGMKES
jgi:hypothetical protein